jgi:polyhydroxyalkanoate synthesis repressor PhaR
MPGETIQIKRYPNRRFYSRSSSKYVSLQDIEEMIRQGHNVEIRDSQSGELMTHAVLTQIIVDRQPEKMSLFPVDMLHSIVRSNDVMTEFLRDYFRHSLTYLNYLQRHGSSARGLSNPMHWVKAWLGGMKASENGGEDEPEATPDREQVLETRIEQLEARLRQLESQIPQGTES